jgi:hypothetical protein
LHRFNRANSVPKQKLRQKTVNLWDNANKEMQWENGIAQSAETSGRSIILINTLVWENKAQDVKTMEGTNVSETH